MSLHFEKKNFLRMLIHHFDDSIDNVDTRPATFSNMHFISKTEIIPK